jgi:hypothetical protein
MVDKALGQPNEDLAKPDEVPGTRARLDPRITSNFAIPGIDIVSQRDFGLKPFRLDFASRRSLTGTGFVEGLGVGLFQRFGCFNDSAR